MITNKDIVKIIKDKNISQEVIDSIYSIIISNNNEEDELEHSILLSNKTFIPYNKSKFITVYYEDLNLYQADVI